MIEVDWKYTGVAMFGSETTEVCTGEMEKSPTFKVAAIPFETFPAVATIWKG